MFHSVKSASGNARPREQTPDARWPDEPRSGSEPEQASAVWAKGARRSRLGSALAKRLFYSLSGREALPYRVPTPHPASEMKECREPSFRHVDANVYPD